MRQSPVSGSASSVGGQTQPSASNDHAPFPSGQTQPLWPVKPLVVEKPVQGEQGEKPPGPKRSTSQRHAPASASKVEPASHESTHFPPAKSQMLLAH